MENNNNSSIEQRLKEFADNIDELSVGQVIFDQDKTECKISDKTSNSVEVFINAKSKDGVSHWQWFDMRSFNRKFKLTK